MWNTYSFSMWTHIKIGITLYFLDAVDHFTSMFMLKKTSINYRKLGKLCPMGDAPQNTLDGATLMRKTPISKIR